MGKKEAEKREKEEKESSRPSSYQVETNHPTPPGPEDAGSDRPLTPHPAQHCLELNQGRGGTRRPYLGQVSPNKGTPEVGQLAPGGPERQISNVNLLDEM